MNRHIVNFFENPIKYLKKPRIFFVYSIKTLYELIYKNTEHENRIFRCSICGETNEFNDFGWDLPIFREKKIIGGGHRIAVECPICKANDRMRWVDYVISKFTNIYKNKCVVLHIAPEKSIEDKIRQNYKCKYITGDIQEGVADCCVNVEKMEFPDNYFDYIIINHVLEHVENERKAVGELSRCLKDGGTLIFSMPICLDQETFEDPNIVSITDRERYYGQMDHVRLYGNDVIKRFNDMGINAVELCVKNILSKNKIKKLRLSEEDRIYIAKIKKDFIDTE